MSESKLDSKVKGNDTYNPFSIPLGSKSFDLVLTSQVRKMEIKNQMRKQGAQAIPLRLQRVSRRDLVGPKIKINKKPENPRLNIFLYLLLCLFV
jgi:hypothetical protein